MKTLITGALGAYVLLSIGAGAQAQPGRIPPIGAYSEPRFQIEASEVRALNETGWDWPFDDEVKVYIYVPAYNVLTVTEEMTIDSSWCWDCVIHPGHRCIIPIAGFPKPHGGNFRGDEGQTWDCSEGGAPGPFSFFVWLYEQDYFQWPHPGQLIGGAEITYSMEELLGLHVGQVLREEVRLSPPPCPGGVSACQVTDAVYMFKWRITRLPDAVVEPILDQ